MKNFNKLLIITIFLSCISFACQQNKSEVMPTSFMELSIDNQKLILPKNDYQTGGNENCNTLFITGKYYDKVSGLNFSLEFQLNKNGAIKDVRLYDFDDNNKTYNAADFKRSETINISNFNYDIEKKSLYFEFDGQLIQIGKPNNLKPIQGKVKFENLNSIPCSFFPSELNAKMNSKELHITYDSKRTDYVTTDYYFYTNNGFRIKISTKTKLQDLELSNYAFNKDSDLKITLHKYIGEIKATQPLLFVENEWIKYDCEGNINITSQVNTPFKHTVGSFNINAKDNNGNIIYEIVTNEFKISNF